MQKVALRLRLSVAGARTQLIVVKGRRPKAPIMRFSSRRPREAGRGAGRGPRRTDARSVFHNPAGSAKITLGHVDYLASLFYRRGSHMPPLSSVLSLTVDSQDGAGVRVCADEQDRPDHD
jgi:hypothetical protein